MSIHAILRSLFVLIAGVLLFTIAGPGSQVRAQAATGPQAFVRTPTETARFVYKALLEKRFREAFDLSVFKPAIDGLSDADFAELRPEFEAMATQGAEDGKTLEYTGEQISGASATVYVRVVAENGSPLVAPIPFVRRNGIWLLGDAETEAAVKKDGNQYFFNVRMDAHEDDAKAMVNRIVKAEFVHATNNAGVYTDIKTLVTEELLPEDVLGTVTTGYRYSVNLSKDNKSYSVSAEPERYGRTGRLSFLVENSILTSKDIGGKPLPRTKN